MPYFKWVGVDLVGNTCKGKQAAHSEHALSEHLLRRGIALLHAHLMYMPKFLWPINAKTKGDVFKHKAQLLRAGILLPQTLHIVAQQSYNPVLADMLFSINSALQHGGSFSAALQKYPQLSDPIVTVILAAGHESGNIIDAIENVAIYYHKKDTFNKNIRSVLAIPFLTLLFFMGISTFIFIFIVPRFADMFHSFDQELPALTRIMISISDFMCSRSLLIVLCIVSICIIMMRYYCVSSGKKVWNSCVSRLPFIGNIVWQHYMSQALQALSLLLNSGITLVSALQIVSESIDNHAVKVHMIMLGDETSSGQLLSSAMERMGIFLPEVIALLHVGEESGTLGQSLEYAAQVYTGKLDQSMKRLIFFLQPAVIILLGILVALLIFAVYLPIMQLSHAL